MKYIEFSSYEDLFDKIDNLDKDLAKENRMFISILKEAGVPFEIISPDKFELNPSHPNTKILLEQRAIRLKQLEIKHKIK